MPRHARLAWYYDSLGRLGVYRRYCEIHLSQVRRLVFVCTGNICRSPFAEAYAKSRDFDAISFGLSTTDGVTADAAAIAAASHRGLSLAAHRARQFQMQAVNEGDLLVAMEPAQADKLTCERPGMVGRVTLLGTWSRPRIHYIFDPYGMDSVEFDRNFSVIATSIDGLLVAMRAARLGVGLADR